MGVFQSNVFQNNVFQGPHGGVVVEAPAGGAFYPTPAELRALRKRLRDEQKRDRKRDEALHKELADAYDESPVVKAARVAAEREAKAAAEMHEFIEFIEFVKFTRTLH